MASVPRKTFPCATVGRVKELAQKYWQLLQTAGALFQSITRPGGGVTLVGCGM
jgi:hypothetical protein